MSPSAPPRLHVLLARDSPLALVLCRTRSTTTRLHLWDRRDDTLRAGGRFRCRLYERRCDISPDGRHWIFFAYDGHGGGGYTGVAPTPSAKAMLRWEEGATVFGGGLFTTPTRVWLSAGGHLPELPVRSLGPLAQPIAVDDGGLDDGTVGVDPGFGDARVYPRRLLRDGWTWAMRPPDWRGAFEAVFEKPLDARVALRMRWYGSARPRPGGGTRVTSYEVVERDASTTDRRDDWDWADWDGRRLLWAACGSLFAARPTVGGLSEARRILDLNPRVAP